MRPLLLILGAIALLLLAGALAPLFRDDPGLVTIHFRDWTVQTSVLVLLLAVLLTWAVVQVLLWFWHLPARTARRVREKRALAQLEKGLLALTEGDWRTAERALERSTSTEGRTTARYLAAAEAAHGQDAEDRREKYLELADSGGGRPKFLVELTRARMLVDSGRRAEAIPILEGLLQRRRRHPQVLELLATCHRDLGHWDALSELLPDLRRAGVLDGDQAEALGEEVAAGTLSNAADADALQAAWKQLSRGMRVSEPVVRAYAARAGALGRADLAEPVIRNALKKEWRSNLVLHYGDPGTDDASKRLKQCEAWLVEHPDDAALHLALGRLCAGQELWGKARRHFVTSLELQPTVVGYENFGQLLERQGELELAMMCFRNALRISQGHPPVPLPVDHPAVKALESRA